VESVMMDIMFEGPSKKIKKFEVNEKYVKERLQNIKPIN
jgi:ATP-dependent protease HslVU (ClpYQ) ATPase subunit